MTHLTNMEMALRLACLWGEIDLARDNTVMARGINEIINGRPDGEWARKATDLATRKANSRAGDRA